MPQLPHKRTLAGDSLRPGRASWSSKATTSTGLRRRPSPREPTGRCAPEGFAKRCLARLMAQGLLGNDVVARPPAEQSESEQGRLRDVPLVRPCRRLVDGVDEDRKDTGAQVHASHPPGHAPEKRGNDIKGDEGRNGEVAGGSPLDRAMLPGARRGPSRSQRRTFGPSL